MEGLELASWSSDFVILLSLSFLSSCLKDATILVGHFCLVTTVCGSILGLFIIILIAVLLLLSRL